MIAWIKAVRKRVQISRNRQEAFRDNTIEHLVTQGSRGRMRMEHESHWWGAVWGKDDKLRLGQACQDLPASLQSECPAAAEEEESCDHHCALTSKLP